MIKQYFTDGLIQIAIILSLLRTDLNNIFLHGNFIQYPEVQEMLLGQTAAYIPSNIHNQFYSSNSLSNFVHPKNIDNDFNSVLFRDLQSLSRLRRIENTDISAFLVDTVATLPESTFASSTPNHTSTNTNNSVTADLNHANVESQNNNVHPDSLNENYGAIALLPVPESTSEDPSDEDLDLIDVLWRQDIDLGIGKDVFDVKLRRELEREKEVELQKKRDKHKELESLRQKLQDEKKNQEQQWLTDNFTQDGETGEWIPLQQEQIPPQMPHDIAITDILSETQLTHLDENLSLQEALDFLNGEVGNLTLPETTISTISTNGSVYPSAPPEPLQPPLTDDIPQSDYTTLLHQNTSPIHEVPMMSPPQQPLDNSVTYVTLQPEPTYYDNNNNNQSLLAPPSGVNRQESFEDRWQDLVNLLDLPPNHQLNDTCLDVDVTNASALSLDNSVLIQNATLPIPMATETNITTLQSPTNDTGLLTSQDYNSSIPHTSSVSELEWTTNDMFLSNISTTINQTETLDDLLLDNVDLDRALNEGLETIQMLDETGSDSAISMGSASPFQEPQDSCSMSPYDGVEGATGGSDYGSPTYSKSSKYDGEDNHFNFNSYGYSGSASSPSNYSTSSNDTDFSKSNGGSHHIRHNHTYPAPPGMQPKEVKKYIKNDRPKHKGPAPKDAKRAAELKVPFTVDQITDSPVEEFNEMLTKYKLNAAQLQLVRDIRRRGKNKVAAQNCRKRKMDVVYGVEDELTQLKHTRDKLRSERQLIDKQTREMKARFSQMYQEIFDSLRDEHGQPYDPNEYSLQQSSDGDVFIVPRNASLKVEDNGKNKKRKNQKK